jgi:hypothetical protein
MSTEGTALVPIVLVSVSSSVVASLLAVWLVSEVFGFKFHPSFVAALSASACAASVAAARLHRQKDRTW